MSFKLSMIFAYGSNPGVIGGLPPRTAGLTESWYAEGSPPALQPLFDTLCQKRAAMLPVGSSIIGQRIQQVAPNGPVSSRTIFFPGQSLTTMSPDIPQMALRVSLSATDGINRETRVLRLIPDTVVIDGEYSPNSTFRNAFAAFATELVARGWHFQGIDKGNANIPIVGIDATTGIVTTVIAHTLAVNDTVLITRAKTSTGRATRILTRVIAVADSTHYTIQDSPLSNLKGGYSRKYAIVRPTIGQVTVGRATTKKVGRPFDSYRGRVSRRRK